MSLFGVYISIFTNSLMFTVVFPMASKMIMYFGLVDNRSKTGYWVGFLGGSIMLGRFISAPIWGWLCDHWGRRPTLLTGIFTTSVLAILFGLSTSFYWALMFRFLQGLLSPITVVTRTIISELYPSKDQASAMSWFILIGSFGNITGNLIGGFFHDTDSSSIKLFEDHPFLLPNSIIALFGLISFVLCYFFLDETKQQESLIESSESRKFMDVIREPIVVQVTLLYIACSANGTAFGELLVLWEWAKIKNGGFEFTTGEIGTLSAVTSLIYIMYVKFLYKFMTDRYGITRVTRNSLLINVPVLFLIPCLTFAREWGIVKYFLIAITNLVYYSIELMSITSSLIMINNSVHPKERGKLNGYTLAIGNLARGFSPPVYGSIFAKTATSGNPYPFNFAFSFFLLAFCVYLAYIISTRLDPSLDHAKNSTAKEEKEIAQEMTAISIVDEREVD